MKMKKVKILTISLVVVMISMIGFYGIYVTVQNRMENKVRDYEYGMDIDGSRTVRLKVSEKNKDIIKNADGKDVTDESSSLTDEELQEKGYIKEQVPYNTEDVLNVDNYKKSKEIIENRLKKQGIENYEISLDEKTGDMVIKIPEDNKTDGIVSNINTVGKFEIIDTDTKEVLLNNSDIKESKVMYGSNSTGTTAGTSVYLDIKFNKDGTKKLEEISNTYKTIEENKTSSEEVNETEENNTDTQNSEESQENKETQKTITMKVDDDTIMSTSFDEIIKIGELQLTVGKASSNQKTVQGYIEQASYMANTLDTGNMPVKYEIEDNKFVKSGITEDEIQSIKIVILVIAIIGAIVLIIKYKTNGMIAGISYIGLLALYLLIIRYTNVILSLQGIFGIIIILILNYIFNDKLLSKIKQIDNNDDKDEEEIKKEFNKLIKEAYKEFFIKIIPVCIAIIVFCFAKWMPISSFGMVMFYGIVLIALYNFVITNSLLKIKTER